MEHFTTWQEHTRYKETTMAQSNIEEIKFDEFQIAHVRMSKTDDNGVTTNHRTTIPPGVDPDAQMQEVGNHLQAMGYPRIVGQQLAQLRSIVAQRHTPAVITAFQNRMNKARNPQG